MTKSLLLLFTLLTSTCWLYSQADNDTNTMNPLYFESPEKAVNEIRKLVVASDWKTLSRYYDLTDSDTKLEELLSSDFFIREERPQVVHPGGFWRYKHPFAPAFKFNYASELEKSGIYEVTLGIEINQGDGMIQKGIQTFRMRKSEKGFQVLPGNKL